MDYQIFKKRLLELVQSKIEEDVRIDCETIPKNNGVCMDGMIFVKKGVQASPIIYVEEYFQLWEKGVSIEQLAEKILWNYGHFGPKIQIAQDFFKDYYKLKSHIFYKLINYERNKEMLKTLPHKRILDLAMVFYYRTEGEAPGATIAIQKGHMAMWGIPVEELERNARKYTPKELPVQFLTMAEVAGMEEGELETLSGEPHMPMYILTNEQKQLGAGVILYPGVLEKAADILGDHFFILPSSVHECILVPDSGSYDQQELSQMVADINLEHVDPQEVLSDQAYYYLKIDGKIHV